jgi:hypothetical protein
MAGHSFRERPRRTVFAIGRPTPTGDWEKIVADINENQHHSRPSRFTLLIAVAVVLGVGVIAYWAEISAFAHLPQLKQSLGL